MVKVNLVHVIRHKHFVEGMAVRRIARQLELSKNTVKRYLRQPETPELSSPPPRQKVERARPKKDAVRIAIRQLLSEWDGRLSQKQRVTGAKLHKELKERFGGCHLSRFLSPAGADICPRPAKEKPASAQPATHLW